jgi:L-ascorbate metabolism protein UlaG (beta-lactamase superfamily)
MGGNGDILDKIKWLGHAGFRIEGSKVVYIDPFNIKGGPKADIILSTHTHHDHLSTGDIKKVAGDDTTLIVSSDAEIDFLKDVRKMKPKDRIEVKGVVVEAVPSYNAEKSFHPKAKNWLGYIVTVDGSRIYHVGDSDFIPEMEGITADVVLIPIGGTYTMDAEAAARAVSSMNVKYAVPMHWGEIVGDIEDAQRFKKLAGDRVEVAILKKE